MIESSPSAGDVPSHDAILAAVRASGDSLLLADALAAPGSYVLDLQKRPGWTRHRLYRVMLTQTAHPTSFWLLWSADRPPAVLTLSITEVNRLFWEEPALREGADEALVATFFDLYRNQNVSNRVDLDRPMRVERREGEIVLEFEVAEPFLVEVWHVRLLKEGEPTIHLRRQPAPSGGATP